MNKSVAANKRAWIPTAGLALSLSAGTASAQQNLIVNGSFESDGTTGVQNFPDWDWLGPAGNHSDYGVKQSTTAPKVAEDGNFYAFFHGNPTDNSQDCLGESVHLTVGSQYTISYYLGTDGPTAGSGAAMWIVIGTSFGIDLSQDVMLTAFMPDSPNALPYQKFSVNYTAAKPDVILSFHGIDSTSSILLDDVWVSLAGPQLNVSLSPSNSLVFAWTASTNAYRLQSGASLDTTNWLTLTNPPQAVSSNYQITVPAPVTNLFYRLTLP